MPEDFDRPQPSSLAGEALRRGKSLRRRRRLLERSIAGVAVAGVGAAVALGIAVKPSAPASPVTHHRVQAVTTTSSLPLHSPRPGSTTAPKVHPKKPAAHRAAEKSSST